MLGSCLSMELLVAQVGGNTGRHVAILFCTTHHEKRYKGMRVSAPGPVSSRFLWLHKGWRVRFRSVLLLRSLQMQGTRTTPAERAWGRAVSYQEGVGQCPGRSCWRGRKAPVNHTKFVIRLSSSSAGRSTVNCILE